MSTSIKVKTNVSHPFDWMNEDEWMWMADMTNETSYAYMDDLGRVIDGSITEEQFAEYWPDHVPEDFKKEYQKRFPSLLAECLEALAECIRKKEIEFEMDFND